MCRWIWVALALAAACKKEEGGARARSTATDPPDADRTPREVRGTAAPRSGKAQPLGGALNVDPAEAASEPDLVVDAGGAPVVAWIEARTVHVARWSGSAWERLPAHGEPGRAVPMRPSLAVEADGGLLVGWSEMNPSTDDAFFQVARWKDGAWTRLGGLHDVGHAEDGSVIGTSFGPVAVWRERHANTQQATIFVRTYIGGAWTSPGEGRLKVAADGDVRDAPALAGRTDGTFAIAWVEHDKAGDTVGAVRRWDVETATWETLPEPPGVDEGSTIDLAAGADGTLVAALGSTFGLRPVMRLPPGDPHWTRLGVAEETGDPVAEPHVATATGAEVLLGYPYGEARLAHHDGTTWTPLSLGLASSATAAPVPALGDDGTAYVAASIVEGEAPAQLRVYVAR